MKNSFPPTFITLSKVSNNGFWIILFFSFPSQGSGKFIYIPSISFSATNSVISSPNLLKNKTLFKLSITTLLIPSFTLLSVPIFNNGVNVDSKNNGVNVGPKNNNISVSNTDISFEQLSVQKENELKNALNYNNHNLNWYGLSTIELQTDIEVKPDNFELEKNHLFNELNSNKTKYNIPNDSTLEILVTMRVLNDKSRIFSASIIQSKYYDQNGNVVDNVTKIKRYAHIYNQSIGNITKPLNIQAPRLILPDNEYFKLTRLPDFLNKFSKQEVLKYLLLNINSFFLNPPKSLTINDIEIVECGSAGFGTGVNVNNYIMIKTNKIMKDNLEIQEDSYSFAVFDFTQNACNYDSWIFEIPYNVDFNIGNGSNYDESKSSIDKYIQNPLNITYLNYYPIPLDAKLLSSTIIDKNNNEVVSKLVFDRCYTKTNVGKLNNLDHSANSIEMKPIEILAHVKGFNNSNVSIDKPIVPPSSSSELKDSSLNNWIYITVGITTALIIIATSTTIVIVKNKKAKLKNQVRVQQYQRPVSQQVKTINTTRTIPSRNLTKDIPPSRKRR